MSDPTPTPVSTILPNASQLDTLNGLLDEINDNLDGLVKTVDSKTPDTNGNIVVHQEVSLSEYNNLPASKLTDDIEYFITDASPSQGGGDGNANMIKACYDEDTALYPHAIDDIIYVNNHLYKVTSPISVGNSIIVGTNVSSDTGIEADTQIYVEKIPGGGSSGGSSRLAELEDVSLTNPVENQVLTVDSNGDFVNGKKLPFDLGIVEGNYGYYNGSNQFVSFKSQADIDAAVAAAKVGDAVAANVLSGKTFTNTITSGITGSMTDNGAVDETINPSATIDQSYLVPAGYHNGSGTVSVPKVSKDTGMTAAGFTYTTDIDDLPYEFYSGSAVVYNNEIHILGSGGGNYTKHYKWNGTTWTEVSILPYTVYIANDFVPTTSFPIYGLSVL